MLYWRAVSNSTGESLATGDPCEPRSFSLASSLVDLRWQFQGQDRTVTLECVDESSYVVERVAPHPAVMALSPERIAEICARFI
jgi:hypothetical protein